MNLPDPQQPDSSAEAIPASDDAVLDPLREQAQAMAVWVRAAAEGDGRAWERLVTQLGPDVLALARRSGLGADDADEVYQDTFLALYRRLDQLQRPEALQAWVRVTAQRISWRVRRKRERLQPLSDAPEPVEERGPEALYQAVEGRKHLATALAQLPERCRRLLELLYLEPDPLSYEAVSERLGMPVGSIGPTRARCLLRLAMQLGRSDSASQGGVPVSPGDAVD